MFKRLSLVIWGRVQGVFFRQNLLDLAERLKLTGWVKNEKNGTLKVVTEGEEIELKKFLAFCQIGPDLAKVEKVEIEWSETQNQFTNFQIIS
jgi:acylphosphatase